MSRERCARCGREIRHRERFLLLNDEILCPQCYYLLTGDDPYEDPYEDAYRNEYR